MERLISVQEAATLLGVSSSKLYKLTSRRQIPFLRIGARCLFRESALERWIQARVVEPVAKPERPAALVGGTG